MVCRYAPKVGREALNSRCLLLELWDDLAEVLFERLLLFAAHQVNIELGYARLTQTFQFPAMLLGIAQNTEAVHDFIGDEIGVAGANFTVMQVIVVAAAANERGQRFRQI